MEAFGPYVHISGDKTALGGIAICREIVKFLSKGEMPGCGAYKRCEDRLRVAVTKRGPNTQGGRYGGYVRFDVILDTTPRIEASGCRLPVRV